MTPNGGVASYYNWHVDDSYGITLAPRKISNFALRTSAATAAMRAVLTRMVTSATTTAGVSEIPTGGKISPGIGDNIRFSYAFFTNSTGEVDYESPNIIYSYGKF